MQAVTEPTADPVAPIFDHLQQIWHAATVAMTPEENLRMTAEFVILCGCPQDHWQVDHDYLINRLTMYPDNTTLRCMVQLLNEIVIASAEDYEAHQPKGPDDFGHEATVYLNLKRKGVPLNRRIMEAGHLCGSTGPQGACLLCWALHGAVVACVAAELCPAPSGSTGPYGDCFMECHVSQCEVLTRRGMF